MSVKITSHCPFCRNELLADASVCRSCGAKRGTRADKGVVGRVIAWLNTIGFLITVVIAIAYQLFYERYPKLGKLELWAAFIGSLVVLWLANKLWIKLFGRVTDEMWFR